MKNNLKIFIADDHAIVRKGMKQLLLEHYPFATVGEAADSEKLVAEVITGNWDVVVCDINMPGRSGIDALEQIKKAFPNLPVLIMSMYPEDQYAVRVLKAGAAGYLGKETIHDDLIKAIETVIMGRKFITPGVAERIAEALETGIGKGMPHDALSARELNVFKMLAAGKTVSEIASALSLSATTVSTYRARVMEKMNMKSNADLVRYALEYKLI